MDEKMELKPCPNPWCEDGHPDWALIDQGAVVRCLNCGIRGPMRENVTYAKQAWNRRPADAELERLREALEHIVNLTENEPDEHPVSLATRLMPIRQVARDTLLARTALGEKP